MTTPLPVSGTLITLAEANSVAATFGKTVTAQNLALAELCISLRTGLSITSSTFVDSMDATDRYWIAQAVVFQALWLPGQPDLLTRIDQAITATDGDSLTINHDGLILAPLAKWAILKTTYMGWDTADAEPTQSLLGTGVIARNPEDVGFRKWVR